MIQLGTRDIFRWHTDETGQSVVEFAMILPALALLVIGVLVVGQVIIAQYVVQSAAREAARVGAEVGVLSNAWALAQSLARDRALQVLQDRGLDTTETDVSFDGSNTNYE
ncbi:MAG: pilus assembly protein, partial [Chloroflexi bacterium]|nr:pilus assembly protein [Chloroflexota bacterium]